MKAFLAGVACLAVAVAATAQDPFSAARDLYASAAYEDALTALTKLHETNAAPAVAERVDQYRLFCLYALGRTVEAQSVAEAIIRKNPLVELDTSDASPRITAMFTDVRKRLLPTLVREQYKTARASVDSKDFVAAEPQLTLVKRMIDEARKENAADDALSDLGVLVDGFLDLTHTALKPPAPAAPANASTAASLETPKSEAPVKVNAPPKVYDSSATDVMPPVIVHQDLPPIPPELSNMMLTGPKSGTLDVVIDESGNVERAVMRDPVNAIYDGLVLAATKSWKYRPATRSGAPVKYLKSIAIVVKSRVPATTPQ